MDLNLTHPQNPQLQTNDQQQHQQQNQQQQQQQQNQQQPHQQNQQPPYTIPGILHYLQYEWHRFEVERQEWEVEKAELSARIALLQGEKKSHENLKNDLIRRIKMLEYCLRMERAKYYKLQHGTDPPSIELGINQQAANKQATDQDEDEAQQKENAAGASNDDANNSMIYSNNNSGSVTYGRELLRHYLREIGYTDNIIDLRSNRVRSLLGIVDNQSATTGQDADQQQSSTDTNNQTVNPDENTSSSTSSSSLMKQQNSTVNTNPDLSTKYVNSAASAVTAASSSTSNTATSSISSATAASTATNKNNVDSSNFSPFAAKSKQTNNTGAKVAGEVGDAEASVLATFGFLYDHGGIRDPRQLDDEEEETNEDLADAVADRAASTSASEYSYFDKEYSSVTMKSKLRNGKADIVYRGSKTVVENQKDQNRKDSGSATQTNLSSDAKSWCQSQQKSDVVDIGELASLTTMNSEWNADESKQWSAKYRLQSHYDCVRALKFSETLDSLLVTASEDETIKLWHLSRSSSNSGKPKQANLVPPINSIASLEGSTLDIEPLHTYRGHTSRVLCVTICKNHIFSGAQNGELIMWKMISDPNTADQYDKFDSSLLVCKFAGHQDAVWSVETLDHSKSDPLLCSASADLTIKIWNISTASSENKEPIGVINLDSYPTCLAKIPIYNIGQAGADMAVSCCDGKIRLYDIASCLKKSESNTQQQPTVTLECDGSHRINSIVIHPTLPFMASADSHHDIKFWDLKTRKCKSTMVAHLDEVTSLAFDPSGKYLLSASHDCSVRLWLFEEKACIQEITSHRQKFDEGILAVAFHPNLPHFATAGADGLAKVFV